MKGKIMVTENQASEAVSRLRLVKTCLEYLQSLADDLPEDALGDDERDRVINAHGQAAGALIYLSKAIEILGG